MRMFRHTLLCVSQGLIVMCWLLLSWVACGHGDDERGVFNDLTTEERAAYDAALGRLSQTAGFEVRSPAYLPEETNWLPDTDYVRHSSEAILTFYPLEFSTSTSESPLINLRQVVDSGGRVCPPCDQSDSDRFEEIQLDETQVLLRDGQVGEGRLFLVAYFRVEAIRVVARFDWSLEQGVPVALTDDMKAEALKVIESML